LFGDESLHSAPTGKKLEWIGLTIIKRYLSHVDPGNRLEDVHLNPQYFHLGVDLILHRPDNSVTTIDLKTDSYYGSDPVRKVWGLCHPDSGLILLETISQLQYDRKIEVGPDGTMHVKERHDVPGWFFTLQADEVYYYFIAILNDASELNPIHLEYRKLARTNESMVEVENRLLRTLKIDRDLLVSFNLRQARTWYESATESVLTGTGEPQMLPTLLW